MTTASTPPMHSAVDLKHSYAQTTHIPFTFHSQTSSPASFGYEYFLSLPPSYSSSSTSTKQWPLILFLHGKGESQPAPNQSYASLRHGIPKVILCYDKMKGGMKPPSIRVPRPPPYPQGEDRSIDSVDEEVCNLCAEEFVTVTPSLNMNFGYGWHGPILSALLDEIVETYRIDLDRIHITGFSMGGHGTWALALHSPNRFASLNPICGWGDAARASLIAHIPQWIHHGDLDGAVSVKKSEDMYAALQKAGAKDLKFTRYPDLNHDCWTDAYSNPELFRWMLEQRRKAGGDEVVEPEDTPEEGGKEEWQLVDGWWRSKSSGK